MLQACAEGTFISKGNMQLPFVHIILMESIITVDNLHCIVVYSLTPIASA